MKKELLPNLKIIIIVLALSSFVSALQSGPSFLNVTTDKARYSPHELVHFSAQLAGDAPAALVYVSYWHLDEEIDAQSFTIATNPVSWTWQPPPLDHQGYLAEIVLQTDEPDTTWIAVDVSSEWNKFPRYGFLSKYPDLSTLQIDNTLNELVRHHINGLQFYDWHYKHHLPLKGTPEQPAEFWPDIANRTNYRATVAGYIKTAHERNMVALSYNLLYGAYRDAATDGVSNEWRLFKDQAGAQPDRHDLPASWASDIYLIDPANPQWLDYILDKTALAFSVFDFDGWHIDQLGDRGVLYDYAGQEVSLPEAFSPFIASTKKSLSGSLVMNAVNQFGQAQIAASPVDFTYTEVWPPHDSYSALVSIIRQNRATGGLATVLAAYVNRARSAQPGTFNTPGVLLADAVIFAAGGAHLELGEHLLGNEYFPNDNLRMSDDLRRRLIVYYDFLVAYQNLLRDGGDFSQDYLQSEGEVTIRNIARRGSVWGFARTVGQRRVFHLINLVKATSLEWRDDAGDQPEPLLLKNMPVTFQSAKEVRALWLASPDTLGGRATNLAFAKSGETIRFVIPWLRYWDMIVADYGAAASAEEMSVPPGVILLDTYPNPFNAHTEVRFFLDRRAVVRVDICSIVGQRVKNLVNCELPAGEHSFRWSPESRLASGVYIAALRGENGVLLTRKISYMK